MWRGLTQRLSLITACFDQLRTISYLCQQSLLLQQETNLLLRELIVKVTTQRPETPEAEKLPLPSTVASPPAPRPDVHGGTPSDARKPRVLTERDITRNTHQTIAEDQFKARAKELYPHREGEILPNSPKGPPSTRPLGLP